MNAPAVLEDRMLNWDLLDENKTQITQEFLRPEKPFCWIMVDNFLLDWVPQQLALDFDTRRFRNSLPFVEMKNEI
jgi:hypothetical protein